MKVVNLSWEEIVVKGKEVARQIVLECQKGKTLSGCIRLYGVPNGGVYAAQAVKAGAEMQAHTFRLVESPREADFIIDDIVDSGKTKAKYKRNYPTKPFYSLVCMKVAHRRKPG